MNPSYFRIHVSLDAAIPRLADWWGADPEDLVETDSVKAVDLACTPDGQWRGGALFLYEREGWSVFEDLSGGFSDQPAEEDHSPITTWMDVAGLVDEDEVVSSETGWLWVNERRAW